MEAPLRILLLAASLLSPGLARALEEPEFTVLARDGAIELRCYAAHVVAQTEVPGGFSAAGWQAFGRLAGYISGENETGRRFAMTAPVNQVPAGTGPEHEDGHVVSFVLPTDAAPDTLPEPRDPEIRLRAVPPRLVAAIAYSGTWSHGHYLDHETQLLAWLEERDEQPVGPSEFARYDGPFTLWFLRRNEVLVEVAGTAERCGGAAWNIRGGTATVWI
jgi:hypothetical protein